LTHFQYKQADERGTRELVESINKKLEKPLLPDILQRTFELWWPKLDKDLRKISESQSVPEVKRSTGDMGEEILELVRGMSRSSVRSTDSINPELTAKLQSRNSKI
jgi:hypothetical protein